MYIFKQYYRISKYENVNNVVSWDMKHETSINLLYKTSNWNYKGRRDLKI